MAETETNEAKLERLFPFRGPCAMCGGPDARHRLWDAITDGYGAGDGIEVLARSYGLSVEAIDAVLLCKGKKLTPRNRAPQDRKPR